MLLSFVNPFTVVHLLVHLSASKYSCICALCSVCKMRFCSEKLSVIKWTNKRFVNRAQLLLKLIQNGDDFIKWIFSFFPPEKINSNNLCYETFQFKTWIVWKSDPNLLKYIFCNSGFKSGEFVHFPWKFQWHNKETEECIRLKCVLPNYIYSIQYINQRNFHCVENESCSNMRNNIIFISTVY